MERELLHLTKKHTFLLFGLAAYFIAVCTTVGWWFGRYAGAAIAAYFITVMICFTLYWARRLYVTGETIGIADIPLALLLASLFSLGVLLMGLEANLPPTRLVAVIIFSAFAASFHFYDTHRWFRRWITVQQAAAKNADSPN